MHENLVPLLGKLSSYLIPRSQKLSYNSSHQTKQGKRKKEGRKDCRIILICPLRMPELCIWIRRPSNVQPVSRFVLRTKPLHQPQTRFSAKSPGANGLLHTFLMVRPVPSRTVLSLQNCHIIAMVIHHHPFITNNKINAAQTNLDLTNIIIIIRLNLTGDGIILCLIMLSQVANSFHTR